MRTGLIWAPALLARRSHSEMKQFHEVQINSSLKYNFSLSNED